MEVLATLLVLSHAELGSLLLKVRVLEVVRHVRPAKRVWSYWLLYGLETGIPIAAYVGCLLLR